MEVCTGVRLENALSAVSQQSAATSMVHATICDSAICARFPLAELAPYPAGSYAWNTGGQDLQNVALPFPIFLLDIAAEESVLRLAARNAKQVIQAQHRLGA